MGFIIACVGLAVGFCGIWWALQKRLEHVQRSMAESFKALSFEVMEKSSRSFLDLAKTTLEKYQEGAKTDFEGRHRAIEMTLKQLDEQQRALERKREGAYAALSHQVEEMSAAEKELRKETVRLVQALRSPQMRGCWGEVHLRRVVELAGLIHHCDFFEQKTLDVEGKLWRPDLVVRLPGDRQIAIDAKTPLAAYLDASDAGDDALRKKKLEEHAAALRKHIKDLATKEYWKSLASTLEYVILFLPAEAFFSSALQADPTLIEMGAHHNIIIATPTTLIAILRAIACSWKQDSLAKSAQEIAGLGQELYDRIGTLCDHWQKVGKNLSAAVEAYNQSLASLDTRVLVTARKLKETGPALPDIAAPTLIEKQAKICK